MSRTKSVGLRGTEMWVYDASLSLVLAEVIRAVEQAPASRRPAWWSAIEHGLRVHAAVSDLYFDLDLGLSGADREDLAQMFEAAADRLLARRVLAPQEAAAWRVLDELPVIFRGQEPQETEPAAELGRALASLIRGTLPQPPPNTSWFFGPPGGRRTIGMASTDERGSGSAASQAYEDVPSFFREGEDPDVVIDELILSRQRIQAIKAVKERYGTSWVEAHHRVLARDEQLHGHRPDTPEG